MELSVRFWTFGVVTPFCELPLWIAQAPANAAERDRVRRCAFHMRREAPSGFGAIERLKAK
jgi:hypothetical protein